MGNVLIFAEHQGGHFPKTTLTAIHAGLDLAKKRGGASAIAAQISALGAGGLPMANTSAPTLNLVIQTPQ